MFLGYNTNGFAHHGLENVIALLPELGYQGIAITPDVHHLNFLQQPEIVEKTKELLQQSGLRVVIETGARFLLNPRRKHYPTLLSTDAKLREVRAEFLRQCIDTCAILGGDAVSFWSGAVETDTPYDTLLSRLVDECTKLSDYAAAKSVRIAFEPEPGMFIPNLERFAELHHRVNHPAFGLTMDIGHLICEGELPVSTHLLHWQDWLWNVHIEDMRTGVHDHVFFGEGQVDFADVFQGLRQANYSHGIYVELSRHSYDAVNIAEKSMQFLKPYLMDQIQPR